MKPKIANTATACYDDYEIYFDITKLISNNYCLVILFV